MNLVSGRLEQRRDELSDAMASFWNKKHMQETERRMEPITPTINQVGIDTRTIEPEEAYSEQDEMSIKERVEASVNETRDMYPERRGVSGITLPHQTREMYSPQVKAKIPANPYDLGGLDKDIQLILLLRLR